MATVNELAARGVDFRSVQEKIDTTSPGGKFLFYVFTAMAEFERGMISERTVAGLTAARGRSGGAKPKLDAEQIAILRRLACDNIAVNSICSIFNISRRTYFRYMAEIHDADATKAKTA